MYICSRVLNLHEKIPSLHPKTATQKVLMYSIEGGLFSKFILCEFINLCSGGRGVSNMPPPLSFRSVQDTIIQNIMKLFNQYLKVWIPDLTDFSLLFCVLLVIFCCINLLDYTYNYEKGLVMFKLN